MYNEIQACESKHPYNPTPIERLKDREKRLKADLVKVQEAIDTLEANPDMAKVVEALQISY